MTDKENNKTNEEENPQRRKFLKNSGVAAGGAVGGGILVGLLGNPFNANDDSTDKGSEVNYTESRQFFKRKQDFDILSAATERIFPEEETGPGAKKLGVPYYIDRQLAGSWGINAKEYMSGPFFEGEPNQGYQTRLKRNELFMAGIQAIKENSNKEYDEEFPKLEEEQQDKILQALENDEIKISGARSSLFFDQLLAATIEGAYADPLYGGNKNMAGWKMKEYPGVQMSYTAEEIEAEKFKEIKPKSLKSYQNY